MSFDTNGKVVSIEEEVALDEVPPAAQAAIRNTVGAGKLQFVETVSTGGAVYYEAHIQSGGEVLLGSPFRSPVCARVVRASLRAASQ